MSYDETLYHTNQKWYGHVMRREGEHVNRRVLEMKVEGVRARGKPIRCQSDCVAEDLKEKNLDEGTDARNKRK